MTTNPQTFGYWEDMSHVPAASHNTMTLDAQDLAHYWRRCSLSSDFWARYTSLFAPVPPAPGHLRRDAVEGVLSYLLNELFENCAKFSGGPLTTVQYQSWVLENALVFEMANHIAPATQQSFMKLIDELLKSDLDELYFQRLEQNALGEGGSGLGYLTLMKDYSIRFGFQFTPVAPESIQVTVQAHVSLKEI